jgi:murein DD-endopeptidase MepM/ murein hydrolase activator NlpD
MTRDPFFIKIAPPGGRGFYRLHLGRSAVAALVAIAALVVVGVCLFNARQAQLAAENVRLLQAKTAEQDQRLSDVDRQAGALAGVLQRLQRQNAEIRRLLVHGSGAKKSALHAALPGAPRAPGVVSARPPGQRSTTTIADVEARLAVVAAQSAAAAADERRLARLTHRVLNVRRMADIARNRMLAAIPSINPVGGGIASAFGYRLSPWPEFHSGVDLEADFGTPVHAAADGVVATAGWESGFGNIVDVDHGNGFHTWYAHLSRFAVAAGRHVRRGEVIAFVGMTGDATGPHLHYQVMHGDRPIDPAPFLHGIPAAVLATLPSPANVH